MPGAEAQVLATELERVSTKVATLFDRDDVFYSALEKRPVEVVSSRDMKVSMEIRPGGKTGYFNSDGGDLGRGDTPSFDKASIPTVNLRHAVEFTAKQMWATDSTRKAVVNAFRHNLATGMAEFRRQVNGQAMTDGTGTIGTISSVSTTSGVDTYVLNTDGFGAKLIRFGQDFSIYSSDLLTRRAGPNSNGETTCTYYDLASKTIKCTAVTGAVAGDQIVFSGLTGTPPVGLLGVKYHNNSSSIGTWLGFDRSITPEIRSSRVTANGNSLSLPLPRLAMNKIGDRVGMNKRKKMTAWCHPCQTAAYEELGFNASRIDKSAKEEGLDLYFNDNLRIAGAPMKTDYMWDKTRIDFIDFDVWGRAEMHPPGFYKNPQDGQKIYEIRGSSGGVATAWIFYYVASFNIFVNNPAGTSYIDQLAYMAGY